MPSTVYTPAPFFSTPSPGPAAPYYQAPTQRSQAQVYFDRVAEEARQGRTVSPQEAAGYGVFSPSANNYTVTPSNPFRTTSYVAPKLNTPVVQQPTGNKVTTTNKTGSYRSNDGTIKQYGTPTSANPMAQENAFIDQNYQAAIDALNAQYGNAQQDYGQNREQLGNYYGNLFGQLGTGRQQALTLNQEQRAQNEKSQQSAIDMASNTYRDLQSRNQQQFGGGSSIGQFAGELQGRALQQGVQSATDVGQQNLGALVKNAQDIETNYTQGVQDLELQKSSALNELDQQFRQITSQIDQQKGGIGTNKAQAKYEALKNYQAEQKAIENKWSDYMMQMNAYVSQAKLQAQSALQQYQMQLGKTPDLNAFGDTPFPSYTPTVDQQTGEVTYPTIKSKKPLY